MTIKRYQKSVNKSRKLKSTFPAVDQTLDCVVVYGELTRNSVINTIQEQAKVVRLGESMYLQGGLVVQRYTYSKCMEQ